MDNLFNMLSSLVIVAGLAIALLKILQLRGRTFQRKTEKHLEVLERKRLSTKVELILVSAMGQKFLLGISDGNVTRISELNQSKKVIETGLHFLPQEVSE